MLPPPTCILGYAQANYPCESLVMLLVGNQILKGGNGNQLYLQEGKMKFSKTL